MIIISLRFDGGSTEEEHDIAHIASSIVARVCGLFFAHPFSRHLLRCSCVGCAWLPQSHTDVCSRGYPRLPPCFSTKAIGKTRVVLLHGLSVA